MNNEQAKTEYIKIIRAARQRMEAVEAAAKKDGTWRQGLDANKHLFAPIEEEAKKQIASLKNKIDQ